MADTLSPAVAELLERWLALSIEDRTRFLVEAWRTKWTTIPHPRVTDRDTTPEDATL